MRDGQQWRARGFINSRNRYFNYVIRTKEKAAVFMGSKRVIFRISEIVLSTGTDALTLVTI